MKQNAAAKSGHPSSYAGTPNQDEQWLLTELNHAEPACFGTHKPLKTCADCTWINGCTTKHLDSLQPLVPTKKPLTSTINSLLLHQNTSKLVRVGSNTIKFETVNYHKTAPAGRGKRLDIQITTKQVTLKKHVKGITLLKLFPVTFQYYKNPKQNILLCSGGQWRNLGLEDIHELYAAVLYARTSMLYRFPPKLQSAKINKFLNAKRPRVTIGKNDGKYIRVTVEPCVIEKMKRIHRKVERWLKNQK